MKLWCGIDWAERYHDVALIDETGEVRARARIGDDAAGFTELLVLLAAHGCDREAPIPVAIETDKGLLVAGQRAAGVPVFAINPLSVSRYRDRHSPSRAKSDKADALVLANILRTDAAVMSGICRAIVVPAGARAWYWCGKPQMNVRSTRGWYSSC